MTKQLVFLLLCCGLSGVAEPLRTDEQLNGVLWVQTSAEYRVSAVQAFRTATRQAQLALADKSIRAALEQTSDCQELPPAVIIDVDETVLDNSPFQARLVQAGQEFTPTLWEKWVNEAKADAVPGAKAFVGFLKEQGIDLFYVTNRKLKEPTLKNIRTMLDPDVTDDHVLCKYEKPAWSSDKTSRRALIAKSHRIILLVGDDYNDFASLGKTGATERTHLAEKYQNRWGTHWILISNPIYGNWERALYNYNYRLSRQEKIDLKLKHLQTQPVAE